MNKRYRAYMDQDEPITDGIDINNWVVPMGEKDKLTYSVWDFAGQTVYYNTHQVGINNYTIYVQSRYLTKRYQYKVHLS